MSQRGWQTGQNPPSRFDTGGHLPHRRKQKLRGLASWYGGQDGFEGRLTANGEIFNGKELTAAHRSLPFGSVVKVTYLKTGRSVHVRINDRGPFVEQRVIDLSRAAAEKIGMLSDGIGEVDLEYYL